MLLNYCLSNLLLRTYAPVCESTEGPLRATQGSLTSHPRYSDPGAVLTFKIKRFPPPRVGNRRDSDTKGVDEGVNFDRNFKCQNPLDLPTGGGGGTLLIHIDECIITRMCPSLGGALPSLESVH